MKSIIIALFFLLPNLAAAQIFAQGNNLNDDADVIYISVSRSIGWQVDYGKNKLGGSTLKNAQGKKVKLQTPIALINYLEKNGWEYKGLEVTELTLGVGKHQKEFNYIFKKKG